MNDNNLKLWSNFFLFLSLCAGGFLIGLLLHFTIASAFGIESETLKIFLPATVSAAVGGFYFTKIQKK